MVGGSEVEAVSLECRRFFEAGSSDCLGSRSAGESICTHSPDLKAYPLGGHSFRSMAGVVEKLTSVVFFGSAYTVVLANLSGISRALDQTW